MIGQQLVFIQGFSRDGVKGPHLQRSFNSGAFVAGQTIGAAAAAAAVRMTKGCMATSHMDSAIPVATGCNHRILHDF